MTDITIYTHGDPCPKCGGTEYICADCFDDVAQEAIDKYKKMDKSLSSVQVEKLAVEELREKFEWRRVVFQGPPPPGCKTWLDWAKRKCVSGVVIRSLPTYEKKTTGNVGKKEVKRR